MSVFEAGQSSEQRMPEGNPARPSRRIVKLILKVTFRKSEGEQPMVRVMIMLKVDKKEEVEGGERSQEALFCETYSEQ